MLRSLSSGVSGVKSHQTLLDVVGDNIANANTTGFKKSTVNFQELMSQTERSATAPGEEKGGINPKQVGLGVSVGSIVVDHSQGNISYNTGSKSDMAIEGDGFFVVDSGSGPAFTRAGNFILDGSGDLVQAGTGFRVQGFQMIDDPLNPGSRIAGSDLVNINIPVGQKLPARATETVAFRCNLDSRVPTVLPMGLNANDLAVNGTIGGKSARVTFSEGQGVSDFLRITFTSDTGSTVTASLPLSGINLQSSLPRLGDAQIDLDGDGNDETVHFDDTSGRVEIYGGTGELLWGTEVGASLNYSLVRIDDGSGGTIPYLAEFNDTPSGNRELVLWGDDGVGGLSRFSVELSVADDGSFELPPGQQMTVGGHSLELTATSSNQGVSLVQSGKTIQTFTPRTSSVHSSKFEIFDSQGNSYTLETSWEKVDNNLWRWRAWLPDTPGVALENNTGLVEFSPDGLVKRVIDPSGAEASSMTINFAALGANDSTIQLDFTGKALGVGAIDAVTQFGSSSTTKEYFQDGYRMGILKDYSVGADGVIQGVYDNGRTQDLYTVALAVFSNPSGLNKLGSGAYRETANSGSPQILKPGEGGAGSIAGSSLEASNVDLTSEFVNLIKAQRGFQASARVITTSDQILEELMNLKR